VTVRKDEEDTRTDVNKVIQLKENQASLVLLFMEKFFI